MSEIKSSGRIFKNPLLEKLTRTHISVPLIVFSAISSYLIYEAIADKGLSVFTTFLLFVIGWLLYSLIEYLMHRFLFHMDESTPTREKLVYTFHGVHHEHPRDKDRLAMPIPVSVTLSAILFLVIRFVIGDYVYAFLPGILMGYAAYLWVHYMVHAFQPPKKGVLKFWWIHHGIHHYKQPERAFGVSSPVWDIIFRTMPDR